MVDLLELDVLVRAAADARERQAPRDRRGFDDRILTLIAIHLAADHHEVHHPRNRAVEPKDRVTELFQNDPMFHAKVMSLHASIMQTIGDYASKKGWDLR